MENEKKDIIYLEKQIELLKDTCLNNFINESKNIIDSLLENDWNIIIKTELKNIYSFLQSSDYINALKNIKIMLKSISSINSYILKHNL